jgi:parvulin-like peptidyl-prolyl isomerase
MPTLAFLIAAFWIAIGAPQESSSAPDLSAVCARVDDHVIRYGDIARERKRRIAVEKIGDAERTVIDAHLREILIDRALALAALERTGRAASRSDVDFELTRRTEELKSQGRTLAEFLEKEKRTLDDYRREILWQLSWNRYLNEYLTDANLEKFFRDRQADYDGRRLRVAHILKKLPPNASEQDRAAAIETLSKLREEIVAGKISFADAAKKHSEAPSASDGGEQGWIERREPMGEEFSKAAFALAAGETSPPVTTPFGVHLIHCLEIEPGKKTWRDVRRELERDAAAYLGKWLADSQRSRSHVERTDVLPPVPAAGEGTPRK